MRERIGKRGRVWMSRRMHVHACISSVLRCMLFAKATSVLRFLSVCNIHIWNYSTISWVSHPLHRHFPPTLRTPYPKTSPGLKGAFSRLLEAGSGGPALGQWWLRWRGAGGAGTHSILNLLAELGRPRGEPDLRHALKGWLGLGIRRPRRSPRTPEDPFLSLLARKCIQTFWRFSGLPSQPNFS